MNVFFVTGFPRSRTSWLANWLTWGPAFCFHDGLAGCCAPGDLREKFRQTGASFVGDSDSALPLFGEELMGLFPGAKWVFVWRDRKEAEESLRRFLAVRSGVTAEGVDGGFDVLEKGLRGLRSRLAEWQVLDVQFEELGDVGVGRRIWNHCVPGVVFHRPRWELLSRLRVEPLDGGCDVRPELTRRMSSWH